MTEDFEGEGIKADEEVDRSGTSVEDGDDGDGDDVEEYEKRYRWQVAQPDYADRLIAAVQRLVEEPEDLSQGDLVVWKPDLQNRYLPADGAPAVVVGVTPGQVSTEANPSSPLYREPLDLQLGIIDGDGDFIVFSFDRRRFTRWVGPGD